MKSVAYRILKAKAVMQPWHVLPTEILSCQQVLLIKENSLLWIMWQAIHSGCCLTTNHATVLNFCILCFGAQRIFNPFPHSTANLMGGSGGLQKC